jgi:nucleotide-binding universal stress UspA family protein
MFKPERILVPTDMSDHADKAIRRALDIAKLFDSEVFLLHVIHEPVQQCTVDYCISIELLNQLQAGMLESARKGMRDQLVKFPFFDPDQVKMDIRTGIPYDEILKEADEREIDLIVISSLGSTGLAKYLMGSVARHVLLGAKCSVLLVK